MDFFLLLNTTEDILKNEGEGELSLQTRLTSDSVMILSFRSDSKQLIENTGHDCLNISMEIDSQVYTDRFSLVIISFFTKMQRKSD